MASSVHEVLTEVAMKETSHLLGLLGISVETEGRVLGKSDFRNLEVPQYFADGVIVFGDPAVIAAVIEVQLDIKEAKPGAWSNYASHCFRRYGCPVEVMVLTPYAEVEVWASRPIEMIRKQPWYPRVFGPGSFPKFFSAEVLQGAPGLGVICALIHQQDPEAELHYEATVQAVAEARAGGDLEEPLATLYIDALIAMASQEWRNQMENKMENAPYLSDLFNKKYFAGVQDGIEKGIEQGIEKGIEQGIEKGIEQGIEKGIEQGIEKGIEQGLRASLLEVLSVRELKPTSAHLAQVAGCEDAQILHVWFRRALVASEIAEVFDVPVSS